MCTVSLIVVHDTLRLVCNRDELRTRPAALPPRIVSRGGIRAIMPMDPESGGTWVAATEAGVAFALLNVSAATETDGRPRTTATEAHDRTRRSATEAHGGPRKSAAEEHGRTRTTATEAHDRTRRSATEAHGRPRIIATEAHGRTRTTATEAHGRTRTTATEAHGRTRTTAAEAHGRTRTTATDVLRWCQSASDAGSPRLSASREIDLRRSASREKSPCQSAPRELPRRSRGEIIPRVMQHRSLEEVVEAALAIDHTEYRAYRLVVATRSVAVEIRPGNAQQSVAWWSLSEPLMFASSSLGDDLVERPRRALFARMMFPGPDLAQRQDGFHLHRWPDRPHLSVLMSRRDASTVSRTVVEISPGDVRLGCFGVGEENV